MKDYIVKKLANNVVINKTLAYLGYKMQMIGQAYKDLPEEYRTIYKRVKPYTMCGENNVYTMLSLVEYIERRKIPGDIVECGVWKGGMMMAVATILRSRNRQLYLYDTFEGMTEPNPMDDGHRAFDLYKESVKKDGTSTWCRGELNEVIKNIKSCGYNNSKIHYMVGKVEDTIPNGLPDGLIAILRLDTDWYSSTKVELEHLYDMVVTGGVVIIDDYGAWQGSKKAVDEFFFKRGLQYYLHRIDNSARYFIKT